VDVTDRGADEQLERRIVVDLLAVEDAAVSMRRVLAEADVGDEDEVAATQLAQRALDDALVVPGGRTVLVLLVGDAEEDDGLDAEADELVRLRADSFDGVPCEPGEVGVRQRLGADEEG